MISNITFLEAYYHLSAGLPITLFSIVTYCIEVKVILKIPAAFCLFLPQATLWLAECLDNDVQLEISLRNIISSKSEIVFPLQETS